MVLNSQAAAMCLELSPSTTRLWWPAIVMNVTGATFTILPAFHQTLWFRSLGVFLFLALVAGLYQLRIRQLARQRDDVRRSERELRDVIDSVPAMVWTARPDGSTSYVSTRFTDYTGMSADQTAGSGWQVAIHSDDLPQHVSKWQASIATGEPHENELRFRRVDGQYRWHLDRGVPLRDEAGTIVKWLGVVTDIEDRKRAEEARRRVEAYLTEAQRLSHTGSWAFNAGGFDYWSSELFQIHGLDTSGRAPSTEEYLMLVHPDDRESVVRAIRKMLADHCGFDFTKRIVRPDGELRYVRCVGSPVANGGTFQGFVGTAVDVTEQEQFEQERERLRRLEAELAHKNRVSMLGEMAASLAHEIRQPIAAAMIDANVCLHTLGDNRVDVQAAREAASRLVKAATRADEIIKRTTALYKKDTTQRAPVNVNAVIREMAALLRQEASASSISIRTELGEGIPDIMADRVQLQQVFMNLMLNAIDAMKDTGGALTITSHMRDGRELTIAVSDMGIGLPTDNPDRIFESFVTTKPHGTGMGLAITRSIVESHGGRVWAVANAGPGATFLFTLLSDEGEARASGPTFAGHA